ncbi:MAG: hypothetical protein H7A23_12550 [Leptospiraceae bacterium]|nr:hypothetical protein [Leptospiraceae bacterium]MCP5495379.1 hypothetical protein [Leptospiraceae bacterium]
MKIKNIIVLLSFLLSNCGTLRFQKYDNFGDWFFGKPGYRGAYFGYEPSDSERFDHIATIRDMLRSSRECGPLGILIFPVIAFFSIGSVVHLYKYNIERASGSYDDPDYFDNMYCSEVISESRQPIYLWLRTPELIFNPQGGVFFPAMDKRAFSNKEKQCIVVKSYERGERGFYFQAFDAGIIDSLIPYRVWTEDGLDPSDKFKNTIKSIFFVIPVKLFQLPFYVIHDVSQLLLIPTAAIYYSTNNGEEE